MTAPPIPRRKLLCVDDDSKFRQFYRTLLGSYGYDVAVAANGRQALKLFLSNKIDAVLTDFEMPEMTGCELAARLKRLRPELPVLLLSGSKSVAIPKAVDASLTKGAPVNKLVDQLEILLAKRFSRPVALQADGFVPLGKVLAGVALIAYVVPRILR